MLGWEDGLPHLQHQIVVEVLKAFCWEQGGERTGYEGEWDRMR